MDLMQKSRQTVEQLLARRRQPMTHEERCRYALDLVAMHLEERGVSFALFLPLRVPHRLQHDTHGRLLRGVLGEWNLFAAS